MSLSNIKRLAVAEAPVQIGRHIIDRAAEEKAEMELKAEYPDLEVYTNPDGGKQVPLRHFVVHEKRFQAEKANVFTQRYDEGYQAGYDAGYKAGYEKGKGDGQTDSRQTVAAFAGILKDVRGQRQSILDDARDKILEMILKISQKITYTAALVDPEVTASIINGTIDQLLDKTRLIIKVHPDHLAELEQHIDRFKGQNTTIKEFRIEADPRVRIGGCFIETPAGDIDARLESMYDVLRDAIINRGGESR